MQVNKLEAFGVSIVLVSQTVDTDALQNATSNIVYGLSVVEPQIPLTVGNDSLSWTEVCSQHSSAVGQPTFLATIVQALFAVLLDLHQIFSGIYRIVTAAPYGGQLMRVQIFCRLTAHKRLSWLSY